MYCTSVILGVGPEGEGNAAAADAAPAAADAGLLNQLQVAFPYVQLV